MDNANGVGPKPRPDKRNEGGQEAHQPVRRSMLREERHQECSQLRDPDTDLFPAAGFRVFKSHLRK